MYNGLNPVVQPFFEVLLMSKIKIDPSAPSSSKCVPVVGRGKVINQRSCLFIDFISKSTVAAEIVNLTPQKVFANNLYSRFQEEETNCKKLWDSIAKNSKLEDVTFVYE